MGGKGGGGDGALRFPPYLEAAHQEALETFGPIFTAAIGASPYSGRADINIEDGFLGSGYTIAQFPSLFDMFGKFMAGLDIESLWSQIYEATTNGPEADSLIASFNTSSKDRMEQGSLPMLNAGMRDIGAINSSAYAIGKSLLESQRIKEVNNFETKVRFQMLVISADRWARHLDWNKSVIGTYTDLQKVYYAGALDVDQLNYKYKESDVLWDLNLFDYSRGILGALTGTPAAKPGEIGPSQVQKSIGGAMSGAAAGAMIGAQMGTPAGPMGAAIGGALGLAASFL